MDTTAFWTLIDDAAKRAKGNNERFLDGIRAALQKLPAAEIEGFDSCLHEALNAAYTWPLWGAAYTILGGCSDDGFEYFRLWLVSRGRAVFEGALIDPDTLAEVEIEDPEDCWLEDLLYIASDAYEQSTGSQLPARSTPAPAEPAGETWEEDGDDLELRFPKLWRKYSQ